MLMDAIESAAVSNCTETRRAGACGSLAPCQNGATCQDLGDTFLCICPPGFAGDTCDNSMNFDIVSSIVLLNNFVIKYTKLIIIIINYYYYFLPEVFIIPQVSDINKKRVLWSGHPSQDPE